ncbi:MAG: AIR carboxylase family protein [Nanoarchaeota archaeon]|nr:MAG: AIR carboxylase family protein [Nanoarchaeota archaeon]
MKVLVIFGSVSDSSVYEPITAGLENAGISYEMRVLSAHRTPKEIDRLQFDSYDAVIAGAGLAAHLPGVVAARFSGPVFGVPCSVAFEGLDSFLSIVQMPPGIPVLCTPVEKGNEAVNALVQMPKAKEMQLCYSKKSKAVEKAVEIFDQFGAKIGQDIEPSPGKINILFLEKGSKLKTEGITIICPICDSSKAPDALEWFAESDRGLWVGLNRGENAALAALQLARSFNNELKKYKEEMRLKVLEADRKQNG